MSAWLKHFPRKGYVIHINNVHLLSGRCFHRHCHHHSLPSLSVHRPCSPHSLSMKYWSSLQPLLSLFFVEQKIALEYSKKKLILYTLWNILRVLILIKHGKNAGRSLCIFCLKCQISNVWFMRLVSFKAQKSERYSNKQDLLHSFSITSVFFLEIHLYHWLVQQFKVANYSYWPIKTKWSKFVQNPTWFVNSRNNCA